MWLKLQAKLLCIQPKFNKLAKAYKRKFQNMYVEYTKAKGGNNTSGNGVYLRKFYDDFDQWWHHSTFITKYVTASA
jgi:hypothetical protein